jgi:hypothetical protein
MLTHSDLLSELDPENLLASNGFTVKTYHNLANEMRWTGRDYSY